MRNSSSVFGSSASTVSGLAAIVSGMELCASNTVASPNISCATSASSAVEPSGWWARGPPSGNTSATPIGVKSCAIGRRMRKVSSESRAAPELLMRSTVTG